MESVAVLGLRVKSDRYYLATQGCWVIDTGDQLLSFVGQLRDDWGQLADEDVAVWEMGRPGRGPRLVAYLRAAPNGSTQVHWVC